MERRKEEQLEKLLAKASANPGLDDIDHRKLSRLIAEADAAETLITGGADSSTVIRPFSPGEAAGPGYRPAASNKTKGVMLCLKERLKNALTVISSLEI